MTPVRRGSRPPGVESVHDTDTNRSFVHKNEEDIAKTATSVYIWIYVHKRMCGRTSLECGRSRCASSRVSPCQTLKCDVQRESVEIDNSCSQNNLFCDITGREESVQHLFNFRLYFVTDCH